MNNRAALACNSSGIRWFWREKLCILIIRPILILNMAKIVCFVPRNPVGRDEMLINLKMNEKSKGIMGWKTCYRLEFKIYIQLPTALSLHHGRDNARKDLGILAKNNHAPSMEWSPSRSDLTNTMVIQCENAAIHRVNLVRSLLQDHGLARFHQHDVHKQT